MADYSDDAIRASYHPRQQSILLSVPVEARPAIIGRAHLLQNLQGGIFSGALWSAREDYNRLGGDLEKLEQLSRRDNHFAMENCARQGCTACARDAAQR